MKLFALPAMLLALAGPAQAGISTPFTVDSGSHWVINDQEFGFDDKVLKPFSGTLRSDLSPLSKCRSSFTADTHASACYFVDQSDWDTPYNQEYLSGFETDVPLIAGLVSRLQVKRDGSYSGYFLFGLSKDEFTEGSNDSYTNSFVNYYTFRFRGVGLAWDLAMDASLADAMWHRESMYEREFSISRMRYKLDPLTGEQSDNYSEGWDGTVNFTAVPEPAAPALFGIGLVALAALRQRKA
jgi:hypothetical protein